MRRRLRLVGPGLAVALLISVPSSPTVHNSAAKTAYIEVIPVIYAKLATCVQYNFLV